MRSEMSPSSGALNKKGGINITKSINRAQRSLLRCRRNMLRLPESKEFALGRGLRGHGPNSRGHTLNFEYKRRLAWAKSFFPINKLLLLLCNLPSSTFHRTTVRWALASTVYTEQFILEEYNGCPWSRRLDQRLGFPGMQVRHQPHLAANPEQAGKDDRSRRFSNACLLRRVPG